MGAISVPLKVINLQDDGYHLLVEITIFKENFFAVLDTGASRSVFDKSLMERLTSDLIESEQTQANTIFSTATTLLGKIPELQIGKLKLKNYEAVAIDLQSVIDTYAMLGHPYIGAIIGGDILMKFKSKIDYKTETLKFYR